MENIYNQMENNQNQMENIYNQMENNQNQMENSKINLKI